MEPRELQVRSGERTEESPSRTTRCLLGVGVRGGILVTRGPSVAAERGCSLTTVDWAGPRTGESPGVRSSDSLNAQ